MKNKKEGRFFCRAPQELLDEIDSLRLGMDMIPSKTAFVVGILKLGVNAFKRGETLESKPALPPPWATLPPVKPKGNVDTTPPIGPTITINED